MSKSDIQEWRRLTVILVKIKMSKSESQELGRLTVRLEQSLGQAVDTNELEWESRVGKINSKTSKIIRLGSRYKWVRVRVKSGED